LIIVICLAIGIIGAFIFLSYQTIPAVSEITPTPSASTEPTPTPVPEPDPEIIAESRANFEKGSEHYKNQNYIDAKYFFEAVAEEDSENYKVSREKLTQCKNKLVADYLQKGHGLLSKTFYLKAVQILDEGLKIYPEDEDLLKLKEDASLAASARIKYEGPVYHVFFHSLIVYPELCFTGDSMEQGYNYWMTTVREFKLMLEEMHSRGYTLISLEGMFSKDADGKVTANDILLPEGKKPLIISVDDVSYYKYMKNDGFAKSLVFDEAGNVSTLVKTPEGNEIVTRDGDVVPILDDFVAANPDFSYNGAKGTLALTGYEGILGYNTLHNNPQWEAEQAKVQPIVDKMKATGWSFANHSFTHKRAFSERTLTLDYLEYDTNRWLKEVGSIVGPTDLYISPFGAYFGQDDPRHKYIVSKGFYVYSGVGSRPYYKIYNNNVFMERINLDGYKMHFSPNVLEDLFDVEKVYDPARPPMK
jgi:tetratricopeptide (TPR) repeat protein